MTKVLHVIHSLTAGGAGRSLLSLVRLGAEQKAIDERVVTLEPVHDSMRESASSAGLSVVSAPRPEQIAREVERADIVLIHFWNTPELFDLLRSTLPPSRFVLWLKVFGEHAPHVLTKQLLEFADRTVATSPSTLGLPVVSPFLRAHGTKRVAVVPGIGDSRRVDAPVRRAHSSFNVGYIGTVDYVKMHPDFVEMSSRVKVPEVRFVVCGQGDAVPDIQKRVQTMEMPGRFDLRGHVEDIGAVLAELDVFGYPLCRETYATSEKSLQEAMLAGVPPIVFPHGGIRDLVTHEVTGLVVRSKSEYAAAIERLYHDRELRARLGRKAAATARKRFDAQASVRAIHAIYDELLEEPKQHRSWSEVSTALGGAAPADHVRGARAFIESLGHQATDFENSLTSEDPQIIRRSDRAIAEAAPVLRSAHSGGLFHYRRYYPDDAFLHYWSGLVLKSMQRPALALGEFHYAVKLGMNADRIQALSLR